MDRDTGRIGISNFTFLFNESRLRRENKECAVRCSGAANISASYYEGPGF
jgi:hypothetical protein